MTSKSSMFVSIVAALGLFGVLSQGRAAAQFPVDPNLPHAWAYRVMSGSFTVKIFENYDHTGDGISDNLFYFWKYGKGTIQFVVDHPASYDATTGVIKYTGTGVFMTTKVRGYVTMTPYPGYPGWYTLKLIAYKLNSDGSNGLLIYPTTTFYSPVKVWQ